MPLHTLSDEERAVDLQSERLRDDPELQKAFDNAPPLKLFDRGEAVRKLQQAFLDLGFGMSKSIDADGEPDGIFGAETLAVVKGFQWRQGIVRDGIVGRQTLGELDGLLSGQTAPGTGASGPQPAGDNIFVRETEVEAPQKGRCGGFVWRVDWDTNARNGYLVQEITHEVEIENCGAPPADWPSTPRYWEAWRVQQDGGIHGTAGADDDWINPSADGSRPLEGFPGTRGRWRTTGRVFFVNQLDPAAGFKIANVPDAGSLWSTTTEPGNLGNVLLERAAGDEWDCCTGAASVPPALGEVSGA